jgi:hypothetical protein
MKRRLLSLFVTLLLAGFGSESPGRQATAAEAAVTAPADVNARMNEVLAQVHKTWRRDAIVYYIELHWYPQEPPIAQYWLEMLLYSPSNHMKRAVTLGGPQDGNVFDMGKDTDDSWTYTAIPDFKIDLPEALVAAYRAGATGHLSFVRLDVVGASGAPPILAWQVSSNEFKLYPLAIDAQTGAVIPWQRAYNPPKWTDEEMRQAWDRVLNRNQPKSHDPHKIEPWECVMMVQETGISPC